MIIAIDSNEYINFLNQRPLILNGILENEKIAIFINEIIVKEVLRHVKETIKKDFYKLLFAHNINVYNQRLPSHLLQKYKGMGLKKGDIEIAAFCENIKADYLVTENRHFLKMFEFKDFKVIALKDFLGKIMKKGHFK